MPRRPKIIVPEDTWPDWKREVANAYNASGKPMKQVSLEAGLNETFLRDFFERTRQPSIDNMAALRDALGIMEPALATGVPLLSWISAGALAETNTVISEDDTLSYVYEGGLDPGGDWIALRVDGRSMDKISPHDSIIFVNRKEKLLVANACYIITDGRGGATYKRYRPPNRFEPVSTKPEDYSTITFEAGQEPEVIGRVRRTVLSL